MNTIPPRTARKPVAPPQSRIPSPRKTFAETGRLVKVTLAFDDCACIGNPVRPYQITRIVNEIAVPVSKESRHVGDFLTEAEATDLSTEPGVEVTTVPAKD